MGLILNIETATKSCSVSIARDGALIALKEIQEQKFSHAEKLHSFIEITVKEAKIQLSDLDAIAVSKGPGSYTGLRIGVSAAKGLSYGLDIPLISISTLETLTLESLNFGNDISFLCPMMDARRMEVYTTVFDLEMNQQKPIEAIVLDDDFAIEFLSQGRVLFFGDGAPKFKEILAHDNAIFANNLYPSSRYMVPLSERKYINKDFEDKAYFEPFYLKDFVATKPKKKV
ncbi:MAG: tRNA threonylcarbamoyladenosine biosynthesis protein TsaB [Patiriisocius sp.]|jgi:tRNA threonylcarbamoyladenosine biosynthesis protein TsaB